MADETPKTLRDWQEEVRAVNEANGWHETPRTFGEGVALLHSEVTEMFEAWRDWGYQDATVREHGDCIAGTAAHAEGNCPWLNGPMKPEGVGSEMADVFIRLMNEVEEAKRAGHPIDLEWEVTRKLSYNRTRGYRHGGKRI